MPATCGRGHVPYVPVGSSLLVGPSLALPRSSSGGAVDDSHQMQERLLPHAVDITDAYAALAQR